MLRLARPRSGIDQRGLVPCIAALEHNMALRNSTWRTSPQAMPRDERHHMHTSLPAAMSLLFADEHSHPKTVHAISATSSVEFSSTAKLMNLNDCFRDIRIAHRCHEI